MARRGLVASSRRGVAKIKRRRLCEKGDMARQGGEATMASSLANRRYHDTAIWIGCDSSSITKANRNGLKTDFWCNPITIGRCIDSPIILTCVLALSNISFIALVYYSRDDAEDSVKYISGTILDDPPISVDFDGDFKKVGNGAVVGVVDSCDGGVVGVVVTDVMVAVGSGGYDDEVG
ncbi:hypothetical protein FXO37_13005 [Capsicum annuum]|nr:hypothetical protein FXO37_13005 [Capsicum annuum]